MAADVEAVRVALNLGKISLLGHSYGGVLAEAYALKYPEDLSHLVLASTFASTKEMNQVLLRVALLGRNRILRHQFLEAGEVDLGVLQECLILLQRADCLVERGLIGPGVDLRQEIALVDFLPLGEGDPHELAGDLRAPAMI